jgi:hypothetical protein
MSESEKPRIYNSALGDVDAQTDELYRRMDAAAESTWWSIMIGWTTKRRRKNEHGDIAALWGGLSLAGCCDEALAKPEVFLHPNTNYSRYELFAASLVVREVFPIPVEDRPQLAERVDRYIVHDKGWQTPPSPHHAELIAGWRAWLRREGATQRPGADLHGEASLFAAASYRILVALRPGGEVYDFPLVAPLVSPVEREPWRE